MCVIDQILAHSPADYVRRPPMPADSPNLGLGHPQHADPVIYLAALLDPTDSV